MELVPNIYDFLLEGKMQIMSSEFKNIKSIADKAANDLYKIAYPKYLSIEKKLNEINTKFNINIIETIIKKRISKYSYNTSEKIGEDLYNIKIEVCTDMPETTTGGCYVDRDKKDAQVFINAGEVIDLLENNKEDFLDNIKETLYHELSHAISGAMQRRTGIYRYKSSRSNLIGKLKLNDEYDKYSNDIDSDNKRYEDIQKETGVKLRRREKISFDKFVDDVLNSRKPNVSIENYFRINEYDPEKDGEYSKLSPFKRHLIKISFIFYKYWNKDEMESFKTNALVKKDYKNNINGFNNMIDFLNKLMAGDIEKEMSEEEYSKINDFIKKRLRDIYPSNRYMNVEETGRYKNFYRNIFVKESIKKIEKAKRDYCRNYYDLHYNK